MFLSLCFTLYCLSIIRLLTFARIPLFIALSTFARCQLLSCLISLVLSLLSLCFLCLGVLAVLIDLYNPVF